MGFCCCCFRSRKGLFILDLDLLSKTSASSHDGDPDFEVPIVADFTTRIIPSLSLWDVGVVKWAENGTVFASTSNQKTHIWDARHETSPLIVTLQKHFRPVTGVDWSPFYPSVLATSSADSSIYLWDIRVAQRDPIQSFMVSHHGAQAVAWNRHDGVKIASAHDNEFRLWDTRKGGGGSIAHFIAHTQQITGIDFSYDNEHEFLTASNDKTVKLWDLSGSRVDSLAILQRVEPVHFAMFAPLHYGRGVLTNQYGIGEQADAAQTISLWSVVNLDSGFVPRYTFRGPSNTILSVCWRIIGHGTGSSVQVASIDGSGMFWLHSVRQEDLNACIPDEPSSSHNEVTDGAEVPTFVPTLKNISLDKLREDLLPEVSTSQAHAGGLWWDLHQVETANIPGVVLEGFDAQTSTVDACITHFDIQEPATVISSLYVRVSFPPHYPALEPPELQVHGMSELESKLTESTIIGSGNNVNDPTSHPLPAKLLEEMRVLAMKTAHQALASGGSCLESILRALSRRLHHYVKSLQGEREEDTFRCTVSTDVGEDVTVTMNDNSLGIGDSSCNTPPRQKKGGGGDDGQWDEKGKKKNDVDPFDIPCPRLFSASFSRNNKLVIFGLPVNHWVPFIASSSNKQSSEPNESLCRASPKEKTVTPLPRTYNLLLEAISERLGIFPTFPYGSSVRSSNDRLLEEGSSSIEYQTPGCVDIQLLSDASSSDSHNYISPAAKSYVSIPEPFWAVHASQVNMYDLSGILPGNRLLATKYVLGNVYNSSSRNCYLTGNSGASANANILTSTSESSCMMDDRGMWGDRRMSSSSSNVSSPAQTLASHATCIETPGYSQPMRGLMDQKQWDSVPDLVLSKTKMINRTRATSTPRGDQQKNVAGSGCGSLLHYNHHSPASSLQGGAASITFSWNSKVSDEHPSRNSSFLPRIQMMNLYETEEHMSNNNTNSATMPRENNNYSPQQLDSVAWPMESGCLPPLSPLSKICFQHNAQSATLVGESEIAAAWAVLTEIVEVCREFGERVLKCTNEARNNPKRSKNAMKKSLFLESCWEQSVLVGPLLGRVLDHYMRIGDPQTTAMLFCTLESISLGKHLILVEDEHIDRCIDAYADLLFIWGALHKRTELLKYKRCNGSSSTTSYSKNVNENTLVHSSSSSTARNECKNIKKSCCSVCQLTLRGIGIYCIACGHGGHPEHISAWFEAGNEACPTGCSCRCLET